MRSSIEANSDEEEDELPEYQKRFNESMIGKKNNTFKRIENLLSCYSADRKRIKHYKKADEKRLKRNLFEPNITCITSCIEIAVKVVDKKVKLISQTLQVRAEIENKHLTDKERNEYDWHLMLDQI